MLNVLYSMLLALPAKNKEGHLAYFNHYYVEVREAFIKKNKKKDDICHLRGEGGVKNVQNVIFLKDVFKIHFKPF